MSIIPDGTKIIVGKVKGTGFPHSTIKAGEIGYIHEYDHTDDSYKITTDTHDKVWIEATRIAPYVNEPVQATLENIRPLDVIGGHSRMYLITTTGLVEGRFNLTRLKFDYADGLGRIISISPDTLEDYKILHNLGDIYRDI